MGAPVDLFFKGHNKGVAVKKFRSLGKCYQEACADQESSRELVARELVARELVARELVEGFGGIAYRAHHLNVARCLELTQKSLRCFQSDDLVLSAHLQEQGICRLKLAKYAVKGFSFGEESDALHKIQDHNLQYEEAIAAIVP
jgi:hypothetical protein